MPPGISRASSPCSNPRVCDQGVSRRVDIAENPADAPKPVIKLGKGRAQQSRKLTSLRIGDRNRSDKLVRALK